MLTCLDINFNSFFHFFNSFIVIICICIEIKLFIDRNQTNLTFKSVNRTHYCNRPILSFIINILNYETCFLRYIIISTNIFVDLVHRTKSLSNISTTFLKNLLFGEVRSFLNCHRIRFCKKTNCSIIFICWIPFGHQK
jgi:hypothetical protein